MKVSTRIDLERQNGREWPDRNATLKVAVVIENAARGDAVAGAMEKALKGARDVVATTLNGTS